MPKITLVTLIRIIIALAVIITLVIAGEHLAPHLPDIEKWVEAQGVWGPVYLIAFGIILSLFCLPLDLACLAGGAVFGLWLGTTYSVIGLIIGQTLVYIIGRYLFEDKILRWSENNDKLKKLRESTQQTKIGLLILLRASPVPASPVAYIMGATRAPFSRFSLANLGMIPHATVMTFFGFATVHTTKLLHDPNHTSTLQHNVFLYGIFLVVVLLVAILAHKARKFF